MNLLLQDGCIRESFRDGNDFDNLGWAHWLVWNHNRTVMSRRKEKKKESTVEEAVPLGKSSLSLLPMLSPWSHIISISSPLLSEPWNQPDRSR
jgi:hypothetical protein